MAMVRPAREVAAGVLALVGTRRPDVVLTAVHGTNHVRDGATKWADRGTGSLALLLAEVTGCGAVVTVGPQATGDANHDFYHPVKTAFLNLPGVSALVDLHGSAHLPDSPDVEIGTAGGHIPLEFVDVLAGRPELHVLVDVARPARNPRRIALLAQAHGIQAVQLEIDALLRPPAGDAARRTRLLDALTTALDAVPERPSTTPSAVEEMT